MTWTYNPASGLLRDKVRLLVGDVNTDRQLLSDEDITLAGTLAGSDLFMTCAVACEAIAAKFARESKVAVQGMDIELRAAYDHYISLADRFRKKKVSVNSLFSVVTEDQKETFEADTNLIKPIFRHGQFDNPDALNSEDNFSSDS